jgi:hypothetical protein
VVKPIQELDPWLPTEQLPGQRIVRDAVIGRVGISGCNSILATWPM